MSRVPAAAVAGGRIIGVAAVYGAVAGVVSAVVLAAMNGLQHLVWTGEPGPLRTIATLLAGALLIVALRRGQAQEESFEAVVASAGDLSTWPWRRILRLAGLGVVAVGFGGAVGPEAGLLAVVMELSTLVSRGIARTQAEQREIGELGVAASLAGLYGSPPGAAAWQEDGLTGRRIPHLVAGAAGFVGFVLVYRALHGTSGGLGIPEATTDGVAALWALVPAVAGAAVAALFALSQPMFAKLGRRLPGGDIGRTLILTAVFALAAAALPPLLFSGHEEIGHVDAVAARGAWGALLALGVLKVLGTALCLEAGWLGGAIFPLLLAGASVGSATLAFLPGLDVGTAMIAGLTASAVVGLRKPLAAFLVCAFVVGGGAWAPLLLATVVGAAVARLLPETDAGH